jgi:hypothetical protein
LGLKRLQKKVVKKIKAHLISKHFFSNHAVYKILKEIQGSQTGERNSWSKNMAPHRCDLHAG